MQADRRWATEAAAGETLTCWQRFSVRYEYPVAFTRGLFSQDNPLLAQTLAMREPDRRHRCLVFLDAGLAEADPALAAAVEGYADAHAETVALAAQPLLVEGGETCKTEPRHLVAAQDAVHAAYITATPMCSRSAAARCSTWWASPRRRRIGGSAMSAFLRRRWPRTTAASA